MSEKHKLPKGWELKTLSELITSLQSGKRPKGGVQNILDGVPSIGAEHLDNNGGFKFKKIKFVPIEFAKSMTKGIIKPNDIIVVKDGATTGKTSIVNSNFPYKQAVINEHVFICRLSNIVIPQWAFYKLWSQQGRKEILIDFRGAAQGGISSSFINYVEIPLPPLPEQEKIVAKIEELFSELDKGKEQLQTALQQLKVYRQGVLKYAFEGKLTNKKVKEGELPKGWKWVKFNDVCSKIGDIDHKMPKQVEKSNYPYLSTKDFTDDLKISFDKAKYISEEDYITLSRKIKPEKGDIIFPRYGTIGKNILIDFDKIFLVSYSCAIVKPNNSLIDSKYIYYLSLSPLIHEEIRKYVVETTQANIGIASIKEFVFPLPKNIEEQQQIVAEIERRLSVCDKIEETINQALSQTETLRQSILKKAFEGKLV